jgi:dipeptidyl aminopeptidase/acylaminoacyl peptidase
MTRRRRASGWCPAAGGDAIPLTLEEVSSEHPRWSPDGKYLAFLSKRDEGKDPGMAAEPAGRRGPAPHRDHSGRKRLCWSPDSKRLVLMLQDPTPEDLDAAKEKATEKSEGQGHQGQEAQSSASLGSRSLSVQGR